MVRDFSFGVLRTNPKLTTNAKLIVTSSDSIYMSSFDGVNTTISDKRYKNYKINPNGFYQYDLYDFWNKGQTPKDYIYDIKPYDKFTVKNDYKDQYEELYSYGSEVNKNRGFKEEFSFFAPLWLTKKIPSKFIVLAVNGPLHSNFDELVSNSTIVKTFDLINSNIGKYLSNYINQDEFPKGNLFVNYSKLGFNRYSGISVQKGGFVNSAELTNDTYEKDTPLISFESNITRGFERTGTAIANLINLEFLFDDEYSDKYTMNRYIGLYVNEFEDGQYDLVSANYIDINKNLILNFTDSVNNYIGTPSIMYAMDSDSGLHRITAVNTTEIFTKCLPEEKTKFGEYTGILFAPKGNNLQSRGRKHATIKLVGNPTHTNFFVIGINDVNHKIYATKFLQRGTFNQNYFSNQGSIDDVTYALLSCIKNINDENISACLKSKNEIIIYLLNEGIDNTYNQILTNDNILDTSFELGYNGLFSGGFVNLDNKIAIDIQFKDYFTEHKDDLYVRTKTGYSKIVALYDYLDKPIRKTDDRIDGFTDINDKIIIELDSTPYLDDLRKLQVIRRDKVKIGRLTVLPIKDFDFDFFSDEYSENDWFEFYEKMFYTNLTGIFFNQVDTYIEQNNLTYPNKRVDGIGNKNYLIALSILSDLIDIENKGNNNTSLISSYSSLMDNLVLEHYHFTFNNFGFMISIDFTTNSNGVRTFIQENYVKELRYLFDIDSSDGSINTDITSEYDRLKENYTKYYSVESRIIPFVNKWVKNSYDVKEKEYRLNSNFAFGIENRTPSFHVKEPTPQYFTHEWYYLSSYPSGLSGVLDNYVNVKLNEGVAIDSIDWSNIKGFFESDFNLDTYFKSDFDYFNQYFTVESIPYFLGQRNQKFVNPQYRFSLFNLNSKEDFAETFFHGVKLYVKELRQKKKISYDVNNLEFVKNNKFVDYKFSAILVPIYYEYDVTYDGSNNIDGIEIKNDAYKYKNVEYKVIRNDKFKHIIFYIQVKLPYVTNQMPKPIGLDYNVLYNLKSFISLSAPHLFLPTPISGAIDLSSQIGINTYRGIANNLGSETNFISELSVNESGVYDGGISVVEIIQNAPDVLRYRINGIKSVKSPTELEINGGITVYVPPLETSDEYYKRTALFAESGGVDYFKNLFKEISFAHIYELVNSGNPKIEYITIDENGVVSNDKTDWILQFEPPDYLVKQNILGLANDNDKPNSLLILNQSIGFDYKFKDKPTAHQIHRYRGWYQPKFREVLQFTDYGLFEYEKDQNLQFDFNSSKFGIIKNYFYLKTNPEASNNILTSTGSYNPAYPLVNEIAMDKRDMNIFLSNWNDDYFIKQIDRNNKSFTSASYNYAEAKTFFGSKNYIIPDEFTIDIFDYTQLNINFVGDKLKIDVNNEKIITDYLIANGLGAYFDSYFDYNQIREKSRYEYLSNYVKENILPRYSVLAIQLWELNTNISQTLNIFNFDLTRNMKAKLGFGVTKNYTLNQIDNSELNWSLINNLSTKNLYNYYSLSVTIAKNKYKF